MSTTRLQRRVEAEFPAPGSAASVLALLEGFVKQCEEDATDDGPWGPWKERVQTAVVVFARGDVEELKEAIAMGLTDWRDLLVAAGLANEDWPARLDQELGPKHPR